MAAMMLNVFAGCKGTYRSDAHREIIVKNKKKKCGIVNISCVWAAISKLFMEVMRKY